MIIQSDDTLQSCLNRILQSGDTNEPVAQYLALIIQHFGAGGVPSGSPGPQGDPGPQGLQGPPGPQGPTGASSSVFHYRADTQFQTAMDPGAGRMRWNNAVQQNATSLYIDRLTLDDFDVTLMFKISRAEDEFAIQATDMATQLQVWKLTGPAISYPDWFEMPVVFVQQSGADFNNNDAISILVKSAGEPGPAGPTGPPGAPILTAADQAAIKALPPQHQTFVQSDADGTMYFTAGGAWVQINATPIP